MKEYLISNVYILNAGMRGEQRMSDRDLLEQWFRAYNQDIYHFLIYYTGSLDIDDLVQEVFIKAYQSMERFNGYSSPKTWLISIARNLAIDEGRKKQRYQKLIPTLVRALNEPELGADKRVLDQESLHEFYEATCQLKKSYQEVLLCRLFNEQTVSETAEILGWTKAKVHLTYHRAIKKLQTVYPLDRKED